MFRSHGWFFWVVATGIFSGLGVLSVCRLFQKYQKIQDLRLGLSGEQAVAEALNQVAVSGFRSFHDLPAGDNWNIDHVAVGTQGVFLIESKARRRRGSRNGQPEHKVIYDGETLRFPTYETGAPIDQARRNAEWLAKYLQKWTGEPVEVKPLVVLPGWYVEFSTNGYCPVKVMNGDYLVRYLKSQNETIEPAQVQRIIARLDEICRDVEF